MKLQILFFVLFITLAQSFGQTKAPESGKFDRRSVTLIVCPVDQATASTTQYTDLVNSLSALSDEARFDINPVSSSVAANFQSAFLSSSYQFNKGKDQENINALTELMKNQAFMSEVLKSTTNLDTLTARWKRSQKRITTSALSQVKIETPTVSQMMSLINGSFIGLTVKGTGTKNNYYWFQLDVSKVQTWNGTTPSASEVNVIFVNYNQGEEPVNKPGSVVQLPPGIVKLAYDMDEFRLRGVIQDATDSYRFDLGKREGLYIDQGFKVYELQAGDDNKIVSKYIGFGRVDKVGDNTEKIDAMSDLYSIIGSYEQGHIVTSYDRGIDVVVRFGQSMVNVPKEMPRLIYGTPNDPTFDYKDDATSSLNIEVAALQNTAKWTGIKQLFVGAVVGYGLPSFELRTGELPPYILETYAVIEKKLLIKRLALTCELQGGMSSVKMTGTTLDGKSWEIATGNQYGFGARVGFEYILCANNPDLYIGGEIGYKYVLPPTSIDYKFGDKSDKRLNAEYRFLDNMKLGGLNFNLKVSYSMPSSISLTNLF